MDRDITECKELEDKSIECEQTYQNIVESSPDGIIVSNLKGVITSVNKAFLDLTGFSEEEIVGKHFTKLGTLRARDAPKFVKIFAGVLRGKVPSVYEFSYVRKDGSVRDADARISLIKLNGKIVGIQAFLRDITEHRKNEALIRESELRYRSLFENSFDGMMLTKPDGSILAANPAACEMLGMTEEEIKEAGRDGIVVRDNKLIAALKKRNLKGKASAELTYKRKDGTTFIGETTSAVFRGKDGVLQTSMIIRDITERKKAEEAIEKSEEKYRDFADSLPEIVFEIGINGKVSFVNRRTVEVLGYSKEQMYTMNFLQFVAPENRPTAAARFRKRFTGRGDFSEYSLLCKDGSTFPALIFSEKASGGAGEPLIRGIALNMSKLRLAEEKLRITNEKLHVVGSLTRHDVRNKLTVIRGRAHLLEMKIGNNPELLKNLEEIDKAIDQCDKMFEFSRLYEKIGAEEPKKVDVGKCFTEAIALLPDLGAIKVVNKCHGLKVMADSMLRQLFYNLLENSLKHGKKVTQIRLYCAKDGGKTELVYEDNGVGIPKRSKGRLFVEGFTTGSGLGLGLKLVKRMIEAYGWTINEAGVPRKGVQFTITVPKQ